MRANVLTYRLATRDDLAAVDALLARSYPQLLAWDYPPSVMVTAVPLLARAQPGLLGSGTYWLAFDADDRLAGVGGWTRGGPGPMIGGGSRTGHVRHVATGVDHLRRGVGSGLLLRVLDQAREAGMERMECLSTRTAVPFYAALGFRALGEVEVPLRPGIAFPAVAMVRDL
ncbi:MAG: GNAT family N-acetyltransferase [Cereibacter sphaeroides]|uniref:GNAT family N-acetyltransferase n=1 Tax=Cereibacter sphaeroides TaxID=1063 RepID=A0A2W5SAK4_CERSP|nr:MAG: GNAT family N-acetyltransferase [Cereibacter sphaeroides]